MTQAQFLKKLEPILKANIEEGYKPFNYIGHCLWWGQHNTPELAKSLDIASVQVVSSNYSLEAINHFYNLYRKMMRALRIKVLLRESEIEDYEIEAGKEAIRREPERENYLKEKFNASNRDTRRKRDEVQAKRQNRSKSRLYESPAQVHISGTGAV